MAEAGCPGFQGRDELLECIQTLEALTAATEDEFLHIGSRLRDFYGGAEEIAESASSVAVLMSGQTITEAIEGLNLLTERVGAYLLGSEAATAGGMEKLRDVSETIGEIHLRLEELEGVSKTLRMLAISNTITCVGLKKADEGNRALSDDIKGLSSLILEKTAAIKQNTRSLLAYLEETLVRLNALRAGSQMKAGAVMKSTTLSIRSLTEKYAVAAEVAGEISRITAEISAGIGKVVTSIQFHDIARQRFESMKTSFADMFGMFDRQEKMAEKSGFSDVSYLTLQFCERQTSLLILTRNEFVSAVEGVKENLRGITAEVKRMLEQAGQVAGRGNSLDGSFLSGVNNSLSSVTATLATLSESELVARELSAAVSHASTTIGEMSGFARQIEEIGDDIGLIALNAQVKAGAIGGEGKALDVIAEAIQRVSRETRTHTAEISELLLSMETLITGLSSADFAGAGGSKPARDMAEDLGKLVRSVEEVNGRIVSAYDGVKGSGYAVLSEIGDVIDGIKVHTLVEAAIGGILSALEKLSFAAGQSSDRRASALAVDSVPSSATGRTAGKENGFPVAAKGSEEFGDNVELF